MHKVQVENTQPMFQSHKSIIKTQCHGISFFQRIWWPKLLTDFLSSCVLDHRLKYGIIPQYLNDWTGGIPRYLLLEYRWHFGLSLKFMLTLEAPITK